MKTPFLAPLITNARFVEVYDDHADESFFGYIIQQSESLLQLEHYDSEGRSEGVLVLRNEDIARIRWEGKERELIEGLITSRVPTPDLKLESIREALDRIETHYGHVCITLGEYGTDKLYIGTIQTMDHANLILTEYGTRENPGENQMLVDLEDITRVQAGGIYETNLIRQLYG